LQVERESLFWDFSSQVFTTAWICFFSQRLQQCSLGAVMTDAVMLNEETSSIVFGSGP